MGLFYAYALIVLGVMGTLVVLERSPRWLDKLAVYWRKA